MTESNSLKLSPSELQDEVLMNHPLPMFLKFFLVYMMAMVLLTSGGIWFQNYSKDSTFSTTKGKHEKTEQTKK